MKTISLAFAAVALAGVVAIANPIPAQAAHGGGGGFHGGGFHGGGFHGGGFHGGGFGDRGFHRGFDRRFYGGYYSPSYCWSGVYPYCY